MVTLFSSLALLSLLFIVGLDSPLLTGIAIAAYGFVTMPYLPISFEFVLDITFPVAEAAAGGYLISLS